MNHKIGAVVMLISQIKERWSQKSVDALRFRDFHLVLELCSDLLSWPDLPDRLARTAPSVILKVELVLDELNRALSLAAYERPNEESLTRIVSGAASLAPLFEMLSRKSRKSDDHSSDFRKLSIQFRELITSQESKYRYSENELIVESAKSIHEVELDLLKAKLDTSETRRRIADEKATQARKQTENLGNQVSRLMLVVEELEHRFSNNVQRTADLESLIKKANASVDEITHIKKNAETLASEAADDVMSGNYGQLASDHESSEKKFRIAALALFFSAALAAALVAWNVGWFGQDSQEGTVWLGLLKKMAVSIGIAGIGLYCSRLATHHRQLAVWSKSLGVQLKTLESYLAGISDDRLKDEIRERFASLTFSGPPSSVNLKQDGHEKAISALAGAIAESIRKE